MYSFRFDNQKSNNSDFLEIIFVLFLFIILFIGGYFYFNTMKTKQEYQINQLVKQKNTQQISLNKTEQTVHNTEFKVDTINDINNHNIKILNIIKTILNSDIKNMNIVGSSEHHCEIISNDKIQIKKLYTKLENSFDNVRYIQEDNTTFKIEVWK